VDVIAELQRGDQAGIDDLGLPDGTFAGRHLGDTHSLDIETSPPGRRGTP
jgi:hypothetical protein